MNSGEEVVFKTSGFEFKYAEDSAFRLVAGDFEVRRHQIISIIGPSGEGKSTLLRIIEGSLLPDSPPTKLIRQRTSMIYQDLRLVMERTALENTLMGALADSNWYQLKFTEAQVEEARGLLKELGLSQQTDQPVSTLSGGQRQRVAIARALMSRPHLLLADEPFSHLDEKTTSDTLELFKGLMAKFKFALVFTTHSLELAKNSSTQTWSVSNGQLSLTSAPRESERSTPTFDELAHASKTKQNVYFLLIGIVIALSFVQIPTDGLNSENAWQELKNFAYKLFVHEPSDFSQVEWNYLFKRLIVTIQMAVLGTSLGFLISWPLSFLAAEGISAAWISRPLRMALMALRSVPALIWALFFVAGLGLGPVAGIAALSLYSVGYFTKLLYEGIEDLERKPFEALRMLGASRLQATRYAILPSSRPLLISSFVFMLEYNVRSASLLGLVGAGGIGQDLVYSIEWRNFPAVFVILLLLTVTVIVFDQISALVRSHFRRAKGI